MIHAPITDVQKMLGHVNVNTTMVYAKTCDEDVKDYLVYVGNRQKRATVNYHATRMIS